jgi:hypothetical protein
MGSCQELARFHELGLLKNRFTERDVAASIRRLVIAGEWEN